MLFFSPSTIFHKSVLYMLTLIAIAYLNRLSQYWGLIFLIFKYQLLIFLCLWVFCLRACMCSTWMPGAWESLKWVLDPLNLELQMVVCHHKCVAIEPRSSAKATVLVMLTHPSSTSVLSFNAGSGPAGYHIWDCPCLKPGCPYPRTTQDCLPFESVGTFKVTLRGAPKTRQVALLFGFFQNFLWPQW